MYARDWFVFFSGHAHTETNGGDAAEVDTRQQRETCQKGQMDLVELCLQAVTGKRECDCVYVCVCVCVCLCLSHVLSTS